ncbi:hypothetical protein DTO046C5_8557 [Penicillium roqueforti]|nr:hypothetical protein DTO046C5_8557 [Penicillium roqueforti]
MDTEDTSTVKGATTEHPQPLDSEESGIPDGEIQQDGVQIADAVTTTWSRKHLIIAYTSMWLVYFVNNLNSSLTANLSAYITSDFSEHSLLTVIAVVTSVMGAACLMPIAKVLNLFDRTVGFVIMTMKPIGDGQSIWYYTMEFDVVGIFLMIGGTILFLTSFNIAGNTEGQWQSPKIIAMMVVGFCVLVAFVGYERWLAPKPFIPFYLLTDRTVIGACLLDITYQVSYYCWASYFTSYLQVVYNTSLMQAGYISAIFDFMDPIWLIGCGFLIRHTGRFKWLLCCALPLYLLASGLMIYFRQPGHNIGYMCMCQIFLAVGGGTFILIEQVSVLAAASHEDYAAMLALLSTFGNIGGAVGSSVSGAIWTNTLPGKLRQNLPADLKDQWEDIYESLDVQLSYAVGSPARIAIQNAYAFSQRNMMIAGTAVMGLSIIWVLMMRNIKVQSNKDLSKVLF